MTDLNVFALLPGNQHPASIKGFGDDRYFKKFAEQQNGEVVRISGELLQQYIQELQQCNQGKDRSIQELQQYNQEKDRLIQELQQDKQEKDGLIQELRGKLSHFRENQNDPVSAGTMAMVEAPPDEEGIEERVSKVVVDSDIDYSNDGGDDSFGNLPTTVDDAEQTDNLSEDRAPPVNDAAEEIEEDRGEAGGRRWWCWGGVKTIITTRRLIALPSARFQFSISNSLQGKWQRLSAVLNSPVRKGSEIEILRMMIRNC